jgi:hypothetical protein
VFVTLQREVVPSLVVTAAYVGSKDNHLEGDNQVNAGIYGARQPAAAPPLSGISAIGRPIREPT